MVTMTSAALLIQIRGGRAYGFELMEATGLPSGTVYPALRRLESAGLIRSHWEKEKDAFAEQRPARKYYRLTAAGEKALDQAQARFPMLAKE